MKWFLGPIADSNRAARSTLTFAASMPFANRESAIFNTYMIDPPQDQKTEVVGALLKGAVSAVPFVGGVIAEVGNLYLNHSKSESKSGCWRSGRLSRIYASVTPSARIP